MNGPFEGLPEKIVFEFPEETEKNDKEEPQTQEGQQSNPNAEDYSFDVSITDSEQEALKNAPKITKMREID